VQDEPGVVFGRLRRRFRVRGIGFIVAGAVLFAFGAMLHSDAAAVGCFVGVGIAGVGAYWAIWLPVFLRRPGNIARIDLHAPGEKYAMQIVMENGRVCRFAASPSEREPIKDALEKQIGVNRLRARVVKR
jgi:hypothetical protein